MTTPITEEQVQHFVRAWYLALDQHAPVEECYRLLATEGLHMRFPDGDIHDFDSFQRWYDRVTHLFFDENHHVHEVEVRVQGESAEVRISVGWQASWFEPPAAKSKRLSLDATQQWIVRRSARNAFGLELVSYDATAEPFRYAPGFARL
ncbi:nuclear transport factor 2 family protein [Pyxidicoccus caerfyrddinensis]|uniref:nuclear transport factor 2 family protein n=1 Tax=Pyxidicoccus caerfyrddinensis TaxID=2709663 RepID=UPI0013DA8888|nr:nuclear transport factor 2 family protein [Pyxidicoccus caerfyrddinensis]